MNKNIPMINAHFLSNIDAKHAKAIKKAAAQTNHEIIISENATDADGYPLCNYIAVFTVEDCDLTDFWNRYDELKAKANEA